MFFVVIVMKREGKYLGFKIRRLGLEFLFCYFIGGYGISSYRF